MSLSPTAPALMSVSDLAAFLGRGRAFAAGLLEDGVLPVIWHRGRRYVARAAVDEWLATGMEVPKAKPKLATFPRQVRRAARTA